MINLVIVLGGMLYAGYQARQEQRAKLHERALVVPAPTVGAGTPPVSPPPLVLEDFQEEYRKRTDHYLGVTVVATGVSFLSIIYPPAGLVSMFRFPDPQGIVNGTLDQTEDHFGTSFGVAKLLFGQVG